MSEDEKQSEKPIEERPQESSVPAETAADHVKEALEAADLREAAKTVWRPGVGSKPPADPFEAPSSSPQEGTGGSSDPGTPESGDQNAPTVEGGTSEGTDSDSSKE